MKKLFSVLLLTFFLPQASNAQVGIGTNTPSPSAQLDVASTERGFLPPRMTSAQRDLIATPATGLLIFQTDNTPGYYFYNGTAWVSLGTTGSQSQSSVPFHQSYYANITTTSATLATLNLTANKPLQITGTMDIPNGSASGWNIVLAFQDDLGNPINVEIYGLGAMYLGNGSNFTGVYTIGGGSNISLESGQNQDRRAFFQCWYVPPTNKVFKVIAYATAGAGTVRFSLNH